LPAVQALNGKPILGERFLVDVWLEQASDAKDYVLVARRRTITVSPGWGDRDAR
jgi:hypothetical protein